MQPAKQALARSRAYHLFARLYLRGLAADLIPEAREIPDLATALPDPFEEDEAAADHYQLFGLDVFPYASLFLEASGQPGGAVTDAVQRQYQQAGWTAAGESADHIGSELAFLAFLSGAETDAWNDGLDAEAERIRLIQRRFMDAHLLWWLPAFIQAVQQQGHAFYATLSDLLLALVFDHRGGLGYAHTAPPLHQRPVLSDLLAQEQTGLKEIATFLTTHAQSGCYLSRSDIVRLGRSERLPHGFGKRALILTNLLRSAITFDRFGATLAQIRGQVHAWQAFYHKIAEYDGLETPTQAWLEHLNATEQMLDQIQDAARREAVGGVD